MDKSQKVVKKIVSKDGSFLELRKNGSLYSSTDSKNAFALSGAIYHGVCNIDEMVYIYRSGNFSKDIDKKKYFPIQSKVLRFSSRLKIRKLRLIIHEQKLTKYGWLWDSKYGYVKSNKFERLLRKRRQVSWYGNKVLLLRKSDAVWRSE
jgi:hypothetical protein